MSLFKWDSGQGGRDESAIHKDVSNEIWMLPGKTAPADADIIIGEDSAASFAKIKITWASIKTAMATYFSGIFAAIANGVTNGNAHNHSGGDGGQISHTSLSSAGTNTHAAIDTFISSKGSANGLASLNTSSLVVQNPANASATPGPNKIPIADTAGKLNGWVSRPTFLTTPLTSTAWDGDARSTTARTLIDLSTVFGVPAGVKAVLVKVTIRDSGSAGADCALNLVPTGGSGEIPFTARCSGLANDSYNTEQGIVPCDSNGDIYYQISASGAGTMDVTLQVWGYYI